MALHHLCASIPWLHKVMLVDAGVHIVRSPVFIVNNAAGICGMNPSSCGIH